MEFHIALDAPKLEDVMWQIDFYNPSGKQDEISSWRAIYSIDSRYQGFVKARIKKWFRHYWMTLNSKAYEIIP
jgi:poly(3-hydroxyalkanoate) synthetase